MAVALLSTYIALLCLGQISTSYHGKNLVMNANLEASWHKPIDETSAPGLMVAKACCLFVL